MLSIVVSIQSWVLSQLAILERHGARARQGVIPEGTERGQTTAEYALVLLGAAAVAVLIVAWAGKTRSITKLLDAVFEQLLSHVR